MVTCCWPEFKSNISKCGRRDDAPTLDDEDDDDEDRLKDEADEDDEDEDDEEDEEEDDFVSIDSFDQANIG